MLVFHPLTTCPFVAQRGVELASSSQAITIIKIVKAPLYCPFLPIEICEKGFVIGQPTLYPVPVGDAWLPVKRTANGKLTCGKQTDHG